MDNAVSYIFQEIEGRYRHSFIITQNIRDYVWESDDPEPFSFPVALCRRISRGRDVNQQDTAALLVAYYSISGGIRLYYNGELVTDDNLEEYFRIHTDLGSLLNREITTPEQQQLIIQPPHVVLPRFTTLLADSGEERRQCCLVIDSADNLVNAHGDYSFEERAVIEILQSWSGDSRIRSNCNPVVLLCAERSHIPNGLVNVDNGYTVIPVAYPNRDERLSFITSKEVEESRAQTLANLTTGFRRVDILESIRRNHEPNEISAKKAEIIRNRCADSLELIESDFGLERALNPM